MTAHKPNAGLTAPDLERAILGSVLQDPVELERLKPILLPEHFAEVRHAHTFGAMLELSRAGTAVDHLTVSARLKAKGVLQAVGGPAYLMELDQGVPLGHSAPEYARTIRQLALRRQAITVAQVNAQKAGDLSVDLDALLTDGARAWAQLTHATKSSRPGTEYLFELIDDLEAAQAGKVQSCIPTGIDRWDEVFGGLQAGRLTFVGSLPGVGKSSLFATMVENLCRAKTRVGFFSLEDQGRWLPKRLLSKRAAVPLFVLAMRPLTELQKQRVDDAAASVHDDLAFLTLDERSMLTPAQIVQAAREMIVSKGVRVLFLDHLGKVDFESKKHHAHDLAIEHGLNELTALAKDYNVPVVIAAHLKEREKDAKFNRPDLESFARTAYIGRDARVAVGLYLEQGNPDLLNFAVLKQTEGSGDGDFSVTRLKECGMVASRNGEAQVYSYADAEAKMLRAVGK